MEPANRIVSFLNELLEIDPAAVSALIAARVPCNQALADHPTVQVGKESGEFRVGLLGLLNGLCGTRENGYGFINAIYDGDANQLGKLIRFEVHTDQPQKGAFSKMKRTLIQRSGLWLMLGNGAGRGTAGGCGSLIALAALAALVVAASFF